mgnify:CR=1 FL=1
MGILDLILSEEARFFRVVSWGDGVFYPRSCMVKGHGSCGKGLKRYKCRVCGRAFNDKIGFHYSSLREWFTLIFLCLYNSCLRWLLVDAICPYLRL